MHPSTSETAAPAAIHEDSQVAGPLAAEIEDWTKANWHEICAAKDRPKGWRSLYQAIRWYRRPENVEEWRRQVADLAQRTDKPTPEGFREYPRRRGRLPDGFDAQDGEGGHCHSQ